jgi:dienelactone hydrolase
MEDDLTKEGWLVLLPHLLEREALTYELLEEDGVEDDLTKEGWLVLLPSLHVRGSSYLRTQ